MNELKVGMRVKVIKTNSSYPNHKIGMIGIIIRADGDFLDHPAYLVSFEGDKWGWYLAEELEMQERRIGKERRIDKSIQKYHWIGQGTEKREQYDRRGSTWVVYSIMYKLKNHYWDSFEKDKELIMKHIHDAIFITGDQ